METKYSPYEPKKAPKVQEAEPAGWKARQATRRRLIQVYHRLDKTVTDLIDERKAERKAKRLDNVQNLTEAIFHTKLAITYLRQIARSDFDKSLEELEGYR